MIWRDTPEQRERREALRRARRYSRACDRRRVWWRLRNAWPFRMPRIGGGWLP